MKNFEKFLEKYAMIIIALSFIGIVVTTYIIYQIYRIG